MPKKKSTTPVKQSADRATRYAIDVVEKRIIAGTHVIDSCKRHLRDLEKSGDDWNYYYDQNEALEAMAFFEEILCLNGGQFEGKPFLLFPWQTFVISSIFGWKRKSDNMRRFRVVYCEQGKGNGKSPMAAGIGLKGLVADNEPRSEIYSAACFRDQAMVLFRDACAFLIRVWN
jgi:phage terminase large subunit-like protein